MNESKLNPDKTKVIVVDIPLDLKELGTLIIDRVLLPFDTQVHSFGMLLDPLMHLDIQVARNAFHQLHLVRRLKPPFFQMWIWPPSIMPL